MLKEKRFEFILKSLNEQEVASYEFIALHLNVSEDTIRRDVDYLHKNGLLSKVRGGAMRRSSNPLSFQDRDNFLKEEKDVIGLKALRFLKDGMTVFMDGGTTICALVNNLPADLKIRIVTTNMMLVPLLIDKKAIELIVVGGNYCHETASTVGLTACNEINTYVADVYMMGICTVDSVFGVTAEVQQDAEVKRAMLKSSQKVIALANHTSLQGRTPFKVCNLEEVDVLITDFASTDAVLDDFRDKKMMLL